MKHKMQTPAAPAHIASDSILGPAPELILAGYNGSIAAAAFSPNNRTLVTSGSDGRLLFWDLPSLELRHVAHAPGHTHYDNLAYSPDGTLLAASTWERLYLLDAATGRPLRVPQGLSGPFTFSPDGKLLACMAWRQYEGDVFALINLRSKRIARTLRGIDRISGIAFSTDGELFGVASYIRGEFRRDGGGAYMATVCHTASGGILHQWCWEQEIEIRTWPGADGPRLIVLVPNHSTVWDAETGTAFDSDAARQLLGTYTGSWSSSWLQPQLGPYSVTTLPRVDHPTSKIGLWAIGSGRDAPAYEITTSAERWESVAMSKNGSWYAAASLDGTLDVWRLARAAEHIGTLGIPQVGLHELAFDEASAALRIVTPPGALSIWRLSTGEVAPPLDVNVFGNARRHRPTVAELAGDWLNLAQPLRGMKLGDPYSPVAVFSHDGRYAIAKSSQQQTESRRMTNACLWDVAAQRIIANIDGLLTHWRFQAAFSPDGEWLAVAADGETIRLYDGRTGTLRRELVTPAHGVRYGGYAEDDALSFAFSSDGKTLATGHSGFLLQTWNLKTGRRRRLRIQRDDVIGLSFAPDGKTLAAVTAYWEDISVFTLGGHVRRRTFNAHSDPLDSVAYSPDGRWLASAAGDGAVKLWDASTLECVATLRLLPDGDEYLLTTPGGHYSGSEGIERYFRVRRGDEGEIVRDEALVRSFRRPIVFEP